MTNGRCIELLNGVISISSYAHSLIDKFFSGPHEVLIGPVDTERFSPTVGTLRDRRMGLCVNRIMPHEELRPRHSCLALRVAVNYCRPSVP